MILPRFVRLIAVFILFLSVGQFKGSVHAQTETPTATPTPTNTPNSAPYCASLTSDITNATGTPQTVTFSCAGVDPGGLIMAAEFVFGDGASQVVEKNVGSPGSISVTHTYTTIGTLGASCRVRDNDNVYSPSVEACKRIVTIRPDPSKAPTASTTVKLSPTPLAATPTAELTPLPTVPINPTLYPQQEELLVESDTGANRLWWIVGGIISIILGFLLLRRRKPSVPHQSAPTAPSMPPQTPVPPPSIPEPPVQPPPTV